MGRSAFEKVSKAFNGQLRLDSNQSLSTRAKAGLMLFLPVGNDRTKVGSSELALIRFE